MRLPRSYVDIELGTGLSLDLPADVSRHIGLVLRMKPGEQIRLFNNRDGRDYPARIIGTSRKQVSVEITGRSEPQPRPELNIHLALGISKGDRMDFAIQKAVELGVTSITPLVTERTNVRLSSERLVKKMNHWQGIVTNACEQCGRSWLAELQDICSLNEWLASPHGAALLLDHQAEHALPDLDKPVDNHINLLVGPEGGLSETEKKNAYARQCTGIRLGPRVLRTETAPLAAIAAIQVLWGDYVR